jgi:hypothetical protein
MGLRATGTLPLPFLHICCDLRGGPDGMGIPAPSSFRFILGLESVGTGPCGMKFLAGFWLIFEIEWGHSIRASVCRCMRG